MGVEWKITSWHRVLLPDYRQLNEQITIKYGWVWCVAILKSCSYTSVIRTIRSLLRSRYFKILPSFRVNVVLVIRLFYYKKIHKRVRCKKINIRLRKQYNSSTCWCKFSSVVDKTLLFPVLKSVCDCIAYVPNHEGLYSINHVHYNISGYFLLDRT